MATSHVLAPQTSRGARIVATLVVAVLLAAVAIPALLYATEGLFYAIGGVFGLVSLLLVFSAVKQMFALATPQTTVEMNVETLKRGAEVELVFRQPGTGSFESLRANLVGEERWLERGYSNKRIRRVRQLGTFNVFDSGPFEAPYESTVRVRIPDLPRADKAHGEYWSLEVWGKVHGRADFQHVFPVEVRP